MRPRFFKRFCIIDLDYIASPSHCNIIVYYSQVYLWQCSRAAVRIPPDSHSASRLVLSYNPTLLQGQTIRHILLHTKICHPNTMPKGMNRALHLTGMQSTSRHPILQSPSLQSSLVQTHPCIRPKSISTRSHSTGATPRHILCPAQPAA